MKSTLAIAITLLLTITVHGEDKADAKKTAKHKFDALELTVPNAWKKKKPSNNLRKGQFEISSGKEDKDPAELTIFNFPGGADLVRANLERWVGQFDSDGRKAALKKGKGSKGTYYLAEISGSYKKPIGPPVLRRSKTVKDYYMLAVIVPTEKNGDYYLKFVGPAKTVKANMEAFRASFGGKKKSEKDYEIKESF